MSNARFTCPGLSIPNRPGERYVACYRAGHRCGSATVTVEDEHGRVWTTRCPCCGDFQGSAYIPWSVLAERDALPPPSLVVGEDQAADHQRTSGEAR